MSATVNPPALKIKSCFSNGMSRSAAGMKLTYIPTMDIPERILTATVFSA
jgi:hypothetical protein